MSPTSLIVTFIVAGLFFLITNKYLPIEDKFIKIGNIVIGIALVIWLLKGFGIGI